MNYFGKIPIDIINHILSFDNRFRISNGVPIGIIPKDDYRYNILKKVCKFHDYSMQMGKRRIERYSLTEIPCKPLSYLQDSLYVILLQKRMQTKIYIEHTRHVTFSEKKHLYYSYEINNYGEKRSSSRIKNMKKAKQLNII